MRMETLHLSDGVILYNDTYNANPQSMKAALRTLAHTDAKRRIAVLGDMGELGENEVQLHEEVGEHAGKCDIDVLICGGIGMGAQNALAAAGVELYAGASGNTDEVVASFLAGTLVKGSSNCNHHHDHGEGGCGHHHSEGGCGHHDHGEGGCCH